VGLSRREAELNRLERFTALARGSGWTPLESWTDAAGMFSVHALVASD